MRGIVGNVWMSRHVPCEMFVKSVQDSRMSVRETLILGVRTYVNATVPRNLTGAFSSIDLLLIFHSFLSTWEMSRIVGLIILTVQSDRDSMILGPLPTCTDSGQDAPYVDEI